MTVAVLAGQDCLDKDVDTSFDENMISKIPTVKNKIEKIRKSPEKS